MKKIMMMAALAVAIPAAAFAADWKRVKSENLFRTYFADKTLTGKEAEMVIHSDGRISGTVSGAALTGGWNWQKGLFCRRAILDGNDLGTDCQKIEIGDGQLRYTRDRGRGRATVLDVSN